MILDDGDPEGRVQRATEKDLKENLVDGASSRLETGDSGLPASSEAVIATIQKPSNKQDENKSQHAEETRSQACSERPASSNKEEEEGTFKRSI